MKLIRSVVEKIPEYNVPQEAYLAKLNQNESPFDLPSEIKAKVSRSLYKIRFNRYPEIREAQRLSCLLAEYTGISPEGVAVGVGSNELIQVTMLSSLNPGDAILVIDPGFGIYPRVANLLGISVSSVPLVHPFGISADEILTKCRGTKAIFIASPNNPTGTTLSIEDIRTILRKYDGLFVLDEAYFEFNDSTAQPLLEEFPNLLILRTFSKALGLAGLRVGYALGSKEIIKAIEKCRLPFSLNSVQLATCNILLEERAYIKHCLRNILREREILFKALSSFPECEPVPSKANFILCKINNNAARDTYLSLKQSGILVRYFNTDLLRDYIRISVGTPVENRALINAIRGIRES